MILLACVLAALAIVAALFAWRTRRGLEEARAELQREREAGARMAALAANNQQKLKALTQSSGAGILMLDERGRIVHGNEAAGEILGTRAENLVGVSILQATLSTELQEFALQVAAGGVPRSGDFPMAGGTGRTLRASVHPFAIGLSGAPESMLVLMDVTELRKLETIRRDFVANVSHELRTPLASIRAMAETLQEGARRDEKVADRFLATIVKESDRLTRISEDLLILANAERTEPERERFDLGPLLEEIVVRLEPNAAEKRIDLRLSVQGPTELWASRDQIEQVIVNLIDNAIKYTPPEGSIEVSARSEPEHTLMSVADTGIGIMQEDQPRVFERFYRVDKGRSRESGGTGLGLSIVKNIIEAHGGEVKVESELNRGSTFTVLLPHPEAPA